MANVWRRRNNGSDTWHFCTNCTLWPKTYGTYDERYTKPTGGDTEFCNQCRSKRDRGECN